MNREPFNKNNHLNRSMMDDLNDRPLRLSDRQRLSSQGQRRAKKIRQSTPRPFLEPDASRLQQTMSKPKSKQQQSYKTHSWTSFKTRISETMSKQKEKGLKKGERFAASLRGERPKVAPSSEPMSNGRRQNEPGAKVQHRSTSQHTKRASTVLNEGLDPKQISNRLKQERQNPYAQSSHIDSLTSKLQFKKKKKRSVVQRSRSGLVVTSLLLLILAFGVIFKLYFLSILQHKIYAERAASNHSVRKIVWPERGNIFDVDGNLLAGTTYTYTVGITPKDVRSSRDFSDKNKRSLQLSPEPTQEASKDPQKVSLDLKKVKQQKESSKEHIDYATKYAPKGERLTTKEIAVAIADILEMDLEDVNKALDQTDLIYVQLKKNIDKETYDHLKSYLKTMSIGGFAIDTNMKRYYPLDDYAGQVIGFASQRDTVTTGIIGLEDQYNTELAGKPSYVYTEVDNYTQSQLPFAQSASSSLVPGQHLKINIRKPIQEVAQEMADWMNRSADPENGAFVIVMDPEDSSVLAMAGSEHVNLNDPWAMPKGMDPNLWKKESDENITNYLTQKIWANKLLQEAYEPGSIFKPFTTSIALDENVFALDEIFSDAPIWVGDWKEYPIQCWAQPLGYNHGDETISTALMHSCNPPFVQLAERVGIQRFYDYVAKMGLTRRTGIDLPSESIGIIHEHPSVIDMATLSFGEQSTVTPIRLANMYCALANGGHMMKPRVAKALMDSDRNIINEIPTEELGRVFSENTTKIVRSMMVPGTRELGSGPRIYMPGFLSAGKTGTSVDGEDDSRVVYSAATITPFDDPKLVVLTSLQRPKLGKGSQIAQIANRTVVAKALNFLGFEARYVPYDDSHALNPVSAGDFVGTGKFKLELCYDAASDFGYRVIPSEGMTNEEAITEQWPAPNTWLGDMGRVYIGSAQHPIPSDVKEQTDVPDFTGLSLQAARALAEKMELNASFTGTNPRGVVLSQSEPAFDLEGNPNKVQKWSGIVLQIG